MATLSFKAKDDFKKQLTLLAENKGINLSALIKLLLTESLKKELSRVTENGMTVAEELELLAMDAEGDDGKVYDNVDDLIKDLND
jgi:hypothetical protein